VLFLIEYDPSTGTTLHYSQYDDTQRAAAESARLERELAVNRAKVDHEVVLLQAPTVEALQRTHARYFDDIEAMIARLERTAALVIGRKERK